MNARWPLVLSRPEVAFGLALWLLNDHLLKARFHNEVTGKLTDLVALVIFPLLVAACFERVTSRPIGWACGFTAIFYGAINLVPAADRWTERLMSLVIQSELTLDQTDLFLLPALGGAVWVWNRPLANWGKLRAAWGRGLFVVGVATTMATSPGQLTSETFTGTAFLTADQPEVVIPFETESEDGFSTEMNPYWDAIFFGDGEIEDLEKAIEVNIDSDADGATVTYRLADPTVGPVELSWSMYAFIDDAEGTLFQPDETSDPKLSVEKPPDSFGPPAVAQIGAPSRRSGLKAFEVVVTASEKSELTVGGSLHALLGMTRAATEDQVIDLFPGRLSKVTRPASCDDGPCTFAVWISRAVDGVVFHDSGEEPAKVERTVEHELVTSKASALSLPVVVADEQPLEWVARVTRPKIGDPIREITTFMSVEGALNRSGPAGDHDAWWDRVEVRPRPGPADPWTSCCDGPLDVTMTLGPREQNTGVASYPFDARVEVTANYRALDPVDPGTLSVTFD